MRGSRAVALIAMFLAGAAWALRAQTQDDSNKVIQDGRISESLVATPAGGLVLRIANKTPHAVTAFALLETPAIGPDGRAAGQNVRYLDSIYRVPILPGDRKGMPGPNATADFVIVPDQLAGRVSPPAGVNLAAVIFDDGSSVGWSAFTQAVVERRKARLQVLRETLQIIKPVQAGSASADQLIADLQQKIQDERDHFHAVLRTNVQKYRSRNGELPPAPPIFMPILWADYDARLGIYESLRDNLQIAEKSGDLQGMMKDLVRNYSNSIEILQNSKPAL